MERKEVKWAERRSGSRVNTIIFSGYLTDGHCIASRSVVPSQRRKKEKSFAYSSYDTTPHAGVLGAERKERRLCDQIKEG